MLLIINRITNLYEYCRTKTYENENLLLENELLSKNIANANNYINYLKSSSSSEAASTAISQEIKNNKLLRKWLV